MKVLFVLTCAPLLLVCVVSGQGQSLIGSAPGGEGIPLRKCFNGSSGVTLYLYTQKNPSTPEVITMDDYSKSSSFNASNPTRFVVHGWMSNYLSMGKFAPAYLSDGKEYNVVLVDWSRYAATSYTTSMMYAQLVAEYLAKVLASMEEKRGLDLESVSLIGMSLGGQLVGALGWRLGGKVAKVVGLDPAGPFFDVVPLEYRLDKSDGKFVQVIHTNAGSLGFLNPAGHIDIYPNGGSKQPGCPGLGKFSGLCSHMRAIEYYTESIQSNDSVAVLCNSYMLYKEGKCNSNPREILGENALGRYPGIYYLDTNSKAPFGRGDVHPPQWN